MNILIEKEIKCRKDGKQNLKIRHEGKRKAFLGWDDTGGSLHIQVSSVVGRVDLWIGSYSFEHVQPTGYDPYQFSHSLEDDIKRWSRDMMRIVHMLAQAQLALDKCCCMHRFKSLALSWRKGVAKVDLDSNPEAREQPRHKPRFFARGWRRNNVQSWILGLHFSKEAILWS